MKRVVGRVVTGMLVAVSAVVAVAGVARAEWQVNPPRAGQLGIGLQGQFGTLLKSGNLGDEFNNGPGVGVRLRYRMRYERALGVSFEAQRFDTRSASSADTASNHLSLFAYGADVYQMFGTRTRTTKWLSAGAGLVQFRRMLNDKEIQFTDSDGVYVSAGGGVERFVFQSWALDLSAKYLTVFQNGKVNHDLQAALGVIVYASY